MRGLMIIGVLLLLAGGYILMRGGSFTTQKDVLKVGDAVKITADEKQAIPSWAGWVGVVAGIGLIAAGAQKKA